MSDEIDGHDPNPILDAIDAAEEILDPLGGLVEKSAEDPGAAFTPEVLERLVALKAEDRAAFEALRAKLKKAGCRVTALDEADPPPSDWSTHRLWKEEGRRWQGSVTSLRRS